MITHTTILICISILATLLTGWIDSLNEAREIWMKNNLPMYVADAFKQKYKRHSLWSVHRIVIFFTTSIPIWYINPSWWSLGIAAINFIAQMALFRFWHDSMLQVAMGRSFTSDSDKLSDSKIDSKIDDTWENRCRFLAGFIMIEILLFIFIYYVQPNL